jgi:hypothetical protein
MKKVFIGILVGFLVVLAISYPALARITQRISLRGFGEISYYFNPQQQGNFRVRGINKNGAAMANLDFFLDYTATGGMKISAEFDNLTLISTEPDSKMVEMITENGVVNGQGGYRVLARFKDYQDSSVKDTFLVEVYRNTPDEYLYEWIVCRVEKGDIVIKVK